MKTINNTEFRVYAKDLENNELSFCSASSNFTKALATAKNCMKSQMEDSVIDYNYVIAISEEGLEDEKIIILVSAEGKNIEVKPILF